MRRQKTFATLIATFLFFATGAHAQQLPKSVAIGSNPPGSLFYSLASGMAKVVSEASPMQAQVQPYAGTSTFVPLFDSGELDFGVVNAVDMGMVYQGQKLMVGGRNPFPHVPSSRLVMRGSPLRSSLIVRKDSPIKTIGDVKGKRVTGEYPAQLAVWYNVFGALSNGGLTWNDVKVVPVPAVNEGVDALVQGRADVTTHAIGSAKVKEADAAVGFATSRSIARSKAKRASKRPCRVTICRSSKPAHRRASSKTPAPTPMTFILSPTRPYPMPWFEMFSRRSGSMSTSCRSSIPALRSGPGLGPSTPRSRCPIIPPRSVSSRTTARGRQSWMTCKRNCWR